jgi:hypothetical protein
MCLSVKMGINAKPGVMSYHPKTTTQALKILSNNQPGRQLRGSPGPRGLRPYVVCAGADDGDSHGIGRCDADRRAVPMAGDEADWSGSGPGLMLSGPRERKSGNVGGDMRRELTCQIGDVV